MMWLHRQKSGVIIRFRLRCLWNIFNPSNVLSTIKWKMTFLPDRWMVFTLTWFPFLVEEIPIFNGYCWHVNSIAINNLEFLWLVTQIHENSHDIDMERNSSEFQLKVYVKWNTFVHTRSHQIISIVIPSSIFSVFHQNSILFFVFFFQFKQYKLFPN